MSYLKVLSALSAVLFITQTLQAESTAYSTVTDDRLEHPDAGDWLMYRRTYDGSGFSPLKQMTPSNIGRLTLGWSVSTDLLGAHETTPIVNRGRMFITTPQNNIIELDKTGCYSTLAPLAVRGKIIVGYSGGEFGVRGSLSDADTGKLKSYHQYTPHDSWDWDEVSAPLLIDTEVDGKLTKTATHAGRNGYLWILDRDRLKFLRAFPFANNNVFTSVDPSTGRPTVDESKRPGAHQGAQFCPSMGGGKDWPPEAWSPQTKLLYVPANNSICGFLPKGEIPKPDPRGFYVGYEAESIFGSVRTGAGASDHLGELQAWDLNTGKRVWQHNFKTILWSPLLVTGGDILFAGGTPDRLGRRPLCLRAALSWSSSFSDQPSALGRPCRAKRSSTTSCSIG
jgi:glucose dehydrogenase